MMPGGEPRTYVKDEAALLRHKQAVDAHRRAQAILRRRHAANVALARIARASNPPEATIDVDTDDYVESGAYLDQR